jgi:hypothetical protein
MAESIPTTQICHRQSEEICLAGGGLGPGWCAAGVAASGRLSEISDSVDAGVDCGHDQHLWHSL